MTAHYKSNKLYDAFDSNAHSVMAKQHKSNKLCHAFGSNARLVMPEHYESTNSTMFLILMLI